MIWILSNRYMPDLFGLSLFVLSFYFISNKKILLGGFIGGLMLGTRLSFFPLLIIPISKSFYKSKNKILFLCSIILGILVWFIPMSLMTGVENLYNVAYLHTVGHFTEYGGTAITESNWTKRMTLFLQTIWSDGLGGFWSQRSKLTLLISILYLPALIFGTKAMLNLIRKNATLRTLFFSIIIYIIWILLFQNIIHKSRHVLPVVYYLIFILSYGLYYCYSKNKKIMFSYIFMIFISLSIVTINLATQHQKPTAIAKISNFLTKKNDIDTIISIPLINYYLQLHGIKANYINIKNESDIFQIDKKKLKNNFIVIGNFNHLFDDYITVDKNYFYHNPYVNRLWPILELYNYKNER
tara:strand:+ start:1006 stop:2067 length:1062 start_codon:yes stop_codon:yes gene_type:complete